MSIASVLKEQNSRTQPGALSDKLICWELATPING